MDDNLNDIELLAAEYVLGEIRGPERLAVTQQLSSNQELRYWVQWWEQQLYSLSLHPKPIAPRKHVWNTLKQRLDGESHTAKHRWWWPLSSALLASACALLLVINLDGINPKPVSHVPSHYASFENEGAVGYLIECFDDGSYSAVAVRPNATEAQKSIELWALVDSKPVSLGVLPRQGSKHFPVSDVFTMDHAELTLAISLEPAGGSYSGQPTGPVLATAQLVKRAGAGQLRF